MGAIECTGELGGFGRVEGRGSAQRIQPLGEASEKDLGIFTDHEVDRSQLCDTNEQS